MYIFMFIIMEEIKNIKYNKKIFKSIINILENSFMCITTYRLIQINLVSSKVLIDIMSIYDF